MATIDFISARQSRISHSKCPGQARHVSDNAVLREVTLSNIPQSDMMSACVRLGRPTIIVRIEKHYYCSDNYHNCRIRKINSLGCSGQPISNNAHLMEESTAPMMEYCILFLDPLRIVWLHGAWQTPCPMPTKCPGETAFKTSQSTLALLFLTRFSSCKYLKNQKKITCMASKRSGQQIQLLCHTQCIAMHNTETTYHEIIDDNGSGLNHIHITISHMEHHAC